MGDPDTREKRAKKFRSRNPYVQEMRDTKGPFKIRVINPKKNYKREKIDIRKIEDIIYEE